MYFYVFILKHLFSKISIFQLVASKKFHLFHLMLPWATFEYKGPVSEKLNCMPNMFIKFHA